MIKAYTCGALSVCVSVALTPVGGCLATAVEAAAPTHLSWWCGRCCDEVALLRPLVQDVQGREAKLGERARRERDTAAHDTSPHRFALLAKTRRQGLATAYTPARTLLCA
mgnify:CR=1 FL=1